MWCRARTSYVFKSISLTKDSSEQDTRGHRRTATSMHQRDKSHDVQACLDSPQHLQRSFLCCYALDEPVGCVPLLGPRLPPMHNTSFNFNCWTNMGINSSRTNVTRLCQSICRKEWHGVSVRLLSSSMSTTTPNEHYRSAYLLWAWIQSQNFIFNELFHWVTRRWIKVSKRE